MNGQVIRNISGSVKNLNGSPRILFMDISERQNPQPKKNYKTFVISHINSEYKSPLDETTGAAILGKEDFISEIKEKFLSGKKADKNVPAINALTDRVSADNIRKEVENSFRDDPVLERNMKIYLTKKFTGKRLKEIGDAFGIGEAAVSQVCRRLAIKIDKDKMLKKSIEGITKRLGL